MHPNAKKVLVILVVLLVICVGIVLYLTMREPGNIVVIVQNGEVIERLDLSREPDRTFTIASADGGQNTVCIENGTIYMLSADCPDQTCVRMGVLQNEAAPIVCLPHKLLIRFGEAETES